MRYALAVALLCACSFAFGADLPFHYEQYALAMQRQDLPREAARGDVCNPVSYRV